MNNMIQDYCILIRNETEDLEKQVKEWIRLGYQPLGGAAYNPNHGGRYFQTMVKYREIKGFELDKRDD